MVNVKGTRRIRSAVELLCEMQGITDKELDAFAKTGKTPAKKTGKKTGKK